jgi:hypothetical protein
MSQLNDTVHRHSCAILPLPQSLLARSVIALSTLHPLLCLVSSVVLSIGLIIISRLWLNFARSPKIAPVFLSVAVIKVFAVHPHELPFIQRLASIHGITATPWINGEELLLKNCC